MLQIDKVQQIEGVTVYGDESLWRWWVAGGFVVWLQAGPYEDSRLPPLAEMDSLVRASRAVHRLTSSRLRLDCKRFRQ